MSDKKIKYEPHPISAERVAELQAQGFMIIDAVFAPADHAEAAEAPAKRGRKPAPEAPAEAE